jgi:mono/diheme cytochrome c family protein
VYSSWGPGKYDPRYNQDGKNTPLVIPPAYGLAQIKNETYTAEGPISYWNAYVAVTQMGGLGNFADPRLKIDVKHSPDRVTPKLPALRAYQHSLPAPSAATGSFNADGAARGRVLFNRTCATCHVGGSGTDNDSGKLHKPAETGVDGAYAAVPPTRLIGNPSARAVAASAVFPRWQRGYAAGRGQTLQPSA